MLFPCSGHKHISIVMDPWLFGIYATTIHTTVRLCLDEDATPEIMNAWMHVLAFILRNMLPSYFGDFSHFARWYEGATNSAPAMNNAAHEEIKVTQQVKELRSHNRSRNTSVPPSRGGLRTANHRETSRTRVSQKNLQQSVIEEISGNEFTPSHPRAETPDLDLRNEGNSSFNMKAVTLGSTPVATPGGSVVESPAVGAANASNRIYQSSSMATSSFRVATVSPPGPGSAAEPYGALTDQTVVQSFHA